MAWLLVLALPPLNLTATRLSEELFQQTFLAVQGTQYSIGLHSQQLVQKPTYLALVVLVVVLTLLLHFGFAQVHLNLTLQGLSLEQFH